MSHRTISHLTILALLATIVLIIPGRAQAQLSDRDIDSLRQVGEAEGWTFTVGKNDATRYPLEDLCGLVVPDKWWEGETFDPCAPNKNLPAAFDWRDIPGGLPPIRNQGGCGSCWAFGTVGPLECNIKIKDSIDVNLSEQWLLSCNHDDWDCAGGWFAHSYHSYKKDACFGLGAVMEADFPYVAYQLPCGCPYEHPYRIPGWAYIGSQSSIPSIDAMKQAILDHGPIAVSVHANSGMQAYNGGIFNECSNGEINHAVVLVGWDDDQGDAGIWIMRNSWGSWWGEGGYMRIPYGCSMIGYAANYIVYNGQLKITDDVLPACSLGFAVSCQLETSGGYGALTWSDIDNDLDGTGLELSPTGLLTGTSMQCGDIEFTARVQDAIDGVAEKKLSITTKRSYSCGDANNDKVINVGDGVYIINYVFSGGPSPLPFTDAGDANADGAINVGDAVYIINYVFKSGTTPACP